MRKYADIVLSETATGLAQPVAGANVQVIVHSSQLNATIYSDDGVTTTGNPVTTDINGRYQFYVANGRYDLKISAVGLTTFTLADIDIHDETDTSGAGATPLPGNLNFSGNVAFSGTGNTGTLGLGSTALAANNAFTGGDTFKTLNGIQFADQYVSTSAVGNPVALANIAGSSTGGTVAANTYACEITYNGATSGETLPSPTSGTIVMSGSTNQLSCAPGDFQTGQVPAGALTYNVYWQTGGAGSFWRGHTGVALTTTDIQTTTPATSGTNPPGSNTALATLPTAQTALGGNPGALIIPATEPANSGWPGTPATGQSIWDQRNGAWLSSQNAKIPNRLSTTDTTFFTVNQTNPLLDINVNNFNTNAEFHSTQFSTNSQFAPIQAALNVGVKTTAGANAFGVFGISSSVDTFNPGQGSGGSNAVAIYAQNVCRATNCHIWAMNPLVLETPGFRPEYANTLEVDYDNNSGTDATLGQVLVEDGIDVISGGLNHPNIAIAIKASTAAAYWQEGLVASNYQGNGIRIQNGAVGAVGILYVPPANDSTFAIKGQNAANNATVWFMHNDGGFQAVINSATAWFQDNSGCTVSATGFYRNCSTDGFAWRNNGNTADVTLAKNTNDELTFNGNVIPQPVAAPTSQKTESAADANVLTTAIPAQAGSYRIRFIMSVSAANAATLGWTATWTDSNGTAQTPTNLSLYQSGTAAPALTFTTSAAGNYYGDAQVDVNNAGTAIVVKLTFSGTSFTAKVSATVERII